MTKSSLRHCVVALCLCLASIAPAASWRHLNDVVLFDPDVAGVQGWGQPRGLTLTAGTGLLKLDIGQPDSSIARSDLNVDGGMVDRKSVV